jgi:pimeloyl-ACP methyl ester carboxylesterase
VNTRGDIECLGTHLEGSLPGVAPPIALSLGVVKNLDRYHETERRLWDKLGVTPVERRVTLESGGEVRVQEVGVGPPVVFIHGVSVAGTSWCLLAAALDGFRCILVDRPGCGLSDPIVGGPLRDLASVEVYADRLLSDLLDALELESAMVAATSYGGLFAFRGAAAAPERVEKLIEYSWLIGAPSGSVPFSARMSGLPGIQALLTRTPMTRRMVKAALRQFGLGRAIDTGAFDDDMIDWAYALLRDTDTLSNDVRSSPKVVTPIKGHNKNLLLTDGLLSMLTMPVLLLWGEDDPNGGAAVGRTFAPRLPNAELVIVSGAEHAPWIDDLQTCVTNTQAFLAT